MKLLIAIAALAALALVACGDASDANESRPATGGTSAQTVRVSLGGNDRLGDFLVAPSGHTLYVFAQDTAGVSNCAGGCLDTWPPLLVIAGIQPTADAGIEGKFAVIARDDGSRQVTYEGAPLYLFTGDSAPGQTNGHGVGDVWFVAAEDDASAFTSEEAPADYTYE